MPTLAPVSLLKGWSVVNVPKGYSVVNITKTIESLVKQKAKLICLDMTALKQIYSNDIRAILISSERAKPNKFSVCVQPECLRTLKATNIDKVIPILVSLNDLA